MAHGGSSYLRIIIVLTVLTLVELGIGFGKSAFPQGLYVGTLMVLAFWKAALVAQHFMHLKIEKKTLTAIVVFPVLLLFILTFALFPDSSSFTIAKKPATGQAAPASH